MQKISCLAIFIVFLTSISTAYSQDANVKWINEHAYALAADTASTSNDLQFLSTELKNNVVFGLGEASHGTKEFYNQKRRIIEYLVVNLEYRQIGFECIQSYIEPINEYITNGRGNLKLLMKDMVLYNTEEIYNLFQLLKQYNEGQPTTKKVRVFGFDREEYAGDPFNRDKYMADNVIAEYAAHKGKTIVWAHNIHLAKDTTMAQFKGLGYHLKENFGQNLYVLGFDTYKGSVTVITPGGLTSHSFEAEQGSFSAMFAKATYANYYLSFNTRPIPFANAKNNIMNIYANWTLVRSLPVKLGIDFDAILFIKNTTASKIILSNN
ncbi:erythromycin esterase [Chitinophaga skermanii]|uniref:Erythromycin esterase n=1 Tax=Chitinophaga skermanii TaxID=331697 RepID=A0A327QWA9_9BACT|nr:erythromycin esterase family protein [Chitinophaga skermanii]RAJ08621.1 erythromycin esterase [Chitinophaga skermanii]